MQKDIIKVISGPNTLIEKKQVQGIENVFLIDEFWTAKQRQGNKLHEVSYRACFKPSLVTFFLDKFSAENDVVYDPFSGRGTTGIQSALMSRIPILNDINPLSAILAEPRLHPPTSSEVASRLLEIPKSVAPSNKDSLISHNQADNQRNNQLKDNLSMFYAEETYQELVNLKEYLRLRKNTKTEDHIDKWIRMVATNRLTGHSPGFFSVYTLPPNQATSRENQLKINKKRNQHPEYRNVQKLILKKTKNLLTDVDEETRRGLLAMYKQALFLNDYSHKTARIASSQVKLIITSPPFLDIVNYAQDNWLRCWFNDIDVKELEKKLSVPKKLSDWEHVMRETLIELKRVLRSDGIIAFEVGEVRNGQVNLDESIVKLSKEVGLAYIATVINKQQFTKTSNIWGVKNNHSGTNTNRIVLLGK